MARVILRNNQKTWICAAVLVICIYGAFILSLHFFESSNRKALRADAVDSTCVETETREQCWQRNLETVLDTEGVGAAFTLVERLYQSEPAFQGDCHGYAHLIGAKAYTLFASGKSVSLSEKASYCGYGFYHGFMEALLHGGGNIQQTRDFCAYVERQIGELTTDARGACYHGIGHGAVDGGDSRAWGNPEAMIAPARKLCEEVSETGPQRYRCMTGIYNALEILSADPKYTLQDLRKDPFAFCSTQSQRDQEGCYTNMMPIFPLMVEEDFIVLARKVEALQESNDSYDMRYMILSGLFHEFIRVFLHDPMYVGKGIRLCRMLDGRSLRPCLDGLTAGHIKYGEPNSEYKKALQFCSSGALRVEEQEMCYRYILTRLRLWYSQEVSRQICAQAPQPYQKYCPK